MLAKISSRRFIMVQEWCVNEEAELLYAVLRLGLVGWDVISANLTFHRTDEELRQHFFYVYPDRPTYFDIRRIRGRLMVYWAYWVAKYNGIDHGDITSAPISPLNNLVRDACLIHTPRRITALGVHMRAQFYGNDPTQLIIPVWHQDQDNGTDSIEAYSVDKTELNGDAIYFQRSFQFQINDYPRVLTF